MLFKKNQSCIRGEEKLLSYIRDIYIYICFDECRDDIDSLL